MAAVLRETPARYVQEQPGRTSLRGLNSTRIHPIVNSHENTQYEKMLAATGDNLSLKDFSRSQAVTYTGKVVISKKRC